MQCVPAADVADGGHRLCRHEGAADDLVPRNVPDHADQAGHIVDRARSSPRHDATAWKIKTKLAEVMRTTGESSKLEGRIEMDDAYLGGARSGGKTGRGNPGKKPIIVAVETDEKGRPRRIKLRRIPRFERARVKSLTKRIIAPGSTVVTDGYQCFHGVKDADCAHVRVTTGCGPRSARNPAFRWVNTMLGNIKASLVGTYRAVCKKHIARYLAEFEWRFNNRFDLAAMIPALGRAAAAAKPAPYWWIKMADYGA